MYSMAYLAVWNVIFIQQSTARAVDCQVACPEFRCGLRYTHLGQGKIEENSRQQIVSGLASKVCSQLETLHYANRSKRYAK